MVEQYFKLPGRKVSLNAYKKQEKIVKLDEKNLEKTSRSEERRVGKEC